MGGGHPLTTNLFPQSDLLEALDALKRDLVSDGGPQISTMRNYRFAIVPYRPAEEFKLRQEIRKLADELKAVGWNVLTISLHALLMKRIHSLGDEVLTSLVERERRLHNKNPERALNHLKEKILPLVEGPEGIAADVAGLITGFAESHPDQAERSLVFVGRAGALRSPRHHNKVLKFFRGTDPNHPIQAT